MGADILKNFYVNNVDRLFLFFSKVITVQIISRLSAMTFAHGVSGKVVYEEVDEDGTTKRTQSSLWVLDIWREGSRRQTLIKSRQMLSQSKNSGLEMARM